MPETTFIVLSKNPYRESALLLSGLSPDFGKLDLVAHGAQKVSAREYPVADLYRELEVEFEEAKNSELHTLRRAEPGADFTALAEAPRRFKFAGRVGNFLLRNSAPGVPLPFTFDTLHGVLRQLTLPEEAPETWSLLQCAVVLKTAFLYENGLLPETASAKQNELLENLVAAGIENSALPQCPDAYWQQLHQWLNSLIEFHQLVR